MVSFTFSTVLALAAAVSSAPTERLQSRAVVAHDSIQPVAQRIQTGGNGKLIETFNPLLHIAHGCQPYPAVADNGDTSGGLQDTGSATGGCRDQAKGQTYARAGVVDGKTCIMYSWYFPKDHPTSGDVAGGHRHDWENIVVCVDDPAAATPKITAAGASSHSGYSKVGGAPKMDGNSPKVEYFTTFPTNHELQFTDTKGKTYPISDWDAMPDAAKTALQNADFGKANVPFKDGSFESKVREATAA
ncbi:necrosis- and ethylene-inducing protein [Colletotrichum karsti]|uniref:Necrosis- and ethylene-inducing protein n=1 Tax=Colletotrichum karsti TaxID=1095194 RepID=A0A9P6HVD2_9PEZI|nr:necrosis- and ethylene-inducing protein [Colletotrichum karsti]KAF9870607.1 necrosis- and ethylene-inducing protein [Colletotrichum karsti]